ncbi:MAG: HlyD family secretion protein [Micavibrio sp.]|nr:HlyD family secretion protein [Micavibrio sp.]
MENTVKVENSAQIHKLPPDTAKPDAQQPAAPAEAPKQKGKRGKAFAILGIAVLLAGTAWGAYWFLVGSKYVSTDNAYVAAEIAQVTPSVGGTVQDVRVVDTQTVKKGDVIVVIDNIDAKLALEQAQAELGRAERRVRGYFASNEGMTAQLEASKAQQDKAAAALASAQSDLDRAKIDLDRRQALAKSGSVSGEEVTNAENAYATAKANFDSATAEAARSAANSDVSAGSLLAATVLTDNTTVDTNPEVALARAKRDQAQVDFDRTTIRAPIDGVVAKRQVQIGQRLQPGAMLLNIVPLSAVHVDANFKEVQLDKVRLGQDVELTSDLYGSGVKFHGHVEGLSGGTGAAFALIPAQNATGNWIKVVQRLPVRVSLDPKELADHPLQVGLSMEATIDIAHPGNGKPLMQTAPAADAAPDTAPDSK